MAGKDKLNFLKFSRIVRDVLNDTIIKQQNKIAIHFFFRSEVVFIRETIEGNE